MKLQRSSRLEGMKQPLKQLAVLKMKLVTATEFSEVFDYFFDYFGENEIFMRMGGPSRQPMLEQVLVHTIQPIIKTPIIVLKNAFFIHLPEQKFIHGAGQFNEYLSNFFYFEDIDSGMMAVVTSPMKHETQIIRFSLRMVGEDPKPPNN